MICIYTSYEALSRAAAEFVAQHTRESVYRSGRFAVALSGGDTPRRLYEHLASKPLREQVPWPSVHVFWGDERCVPSDDPRSNERMARSLLLDHVPIPPEQFHPIRCAEQPRRAAEEYEALLRAFFGDGPPRFDLVMLGLGGDGHTASLFPGTQAVDERERWVVDVYLAEQKMHRVTMTAPLINQASTVLFVVSGSEKRATLKEVLQGPREPHRLPAQLIQPVDGKAYWLVDRQAMGLP